MDEVPVSDESTLSLVSVFTEIEIADRTCAGYAAVLRSGGVVKSVSGSIETGSDKTAALKAVIVGLEQLKRACAVQIWSPNQDVVAIINGQSDGGPAVDELMLRLFSLTARHKIRAFCFERGQGPDQVKLARDQARAAIPRAAGTEAPMPVEVERQSAREVGDVLLTEETIHALSGSRSKNAFTRKQLELLGVGRGTEEPLGELAALDDGP